MNLIEDIRKFVNEKILHKESQKLLGASKIVSENKINIDEILEYIEKQKNAKQYKIIYMDINKSEKKELLKKLSIQEEKYIYKHEDKILLEGLISNQHFISVPIINLKQNQVGQTIVTENWYINMQTRAVENDEEELKDLNYEEVKKSGNVKEVMQFNKNDAKYSREITINGVTYTESASYGNKEKENLVEICAEPVADSELQQKYRELTGLKRISNEIGYHISDIVRGEPYVVSLSQKYTEKNNIVAENEIIRIFKSKKECIVGYRPEMVLFKTTREQHTNMKLYRLLPGDEGLYVDNSSFKENFEGEYDIKRVTLDEIKKLAEGQPFTLSAEAKNALRYGLKLRDAIKEIYIKGLEK